MAGTALTTPCIEWPKGKQSMGYGWLWVRERQHMELAHRWAVAKVEGWEAIEGKVVRHVCDNPACYRYDHLRIGTQAENLADMRAKGRGGGTFVGGATHCRRGHEYTPVTTYVGPNGRRTCRLCLALTNARYQTKHRRRDT